jgi:Transposase
VPVDAAALESPIVKAYLLKEDLRRFWTYRSTAWAGGHLMQWLWRASHSRLEPFKKLARMLRAHLAGLDQAPGEQRRPGRHEQQGQGHQPSRLWLSDIVDVHREHLPLLRGPPATVTLSGDEPVFQQACPPTSSL